MSVNSNDFYTEEVGVVIGVVIAVFVIGGVFLVGLFTSVETDEDSLSLSQEILMNQLLVERSMATSSIEINSASTTVTDYTDTIQISF